MALASSPPLLRNRDGAGEVAKEEWTRDSLIARAAARG